MVTSSFNYLKTGGDAIGFELEGQVGRVPPPELGLSQDQEARAERLLEGNFAISLHDHPMVYPKDPWETPAYIRSGRFEFGADGLRSSGLNAVFDNLLGGTACITSTNGWKWSDTVLDIGMRVCDIEHRDNVHVVRRLDDLTTHGTDSVGVVLGLEAATCIENELDRLDVLYGLGVRQVGIAYNAANDLGCGLGETSDWGLSNFGRHSVQRMNDLGMLIDISHSSDRTSLEVIEASEDPVAITHTGARAIWPTKRLKPDDVLRACAQKGGVVGIMAVPNSIATLERPVSSIDSVMEHLEYCADLVGLEHVALGPDTVYGDHVKGHEVSARQFARASADWEVQVSAPVPYLDGLESPTDCFRNVTRWLVLHGFSDSEIVNVLGGNVFRVLERVWA